MNLNWSKKGGMDMPKKNCFSFEIKIEEWYKDKERLVEKGDLAPSYSKELKRYMDKIMIPYFCASDIRNICTGDIEAFYHNLRSNFSAKTTKNILDALRNFFFDMRRKEYINHCPQIPKITLPEPEWRWIDENTQNALIQAIPEKHRPIYVFMARQAVRPGEARALHWEDIDFEREIITIRRTYSLDKLMSFTNKRVRFLPIHPQVLEILKASQGISGLVFRNREAPYSASVLWYHWESAKNFLVKAEKLTAEAAKKLRLYDGTRHSVASQSVNRGVDLNLIGKVLGHSKDNMAKRSAHAMTEALRKVIEAPDRPQNKFM